MDQPQWNEVLDALQEDVDFCEDGETTIARDRAVAIPEVFYIIDDGRGDVEENEVPQILLQARPAFDILDTKLFERISMHRRNPEDSSAPHEVQVVELSGSA